MKFEDLKKKERKRIKKFRKEIAKIRALDPNILKRLKLTKDEDQDGKDGPKA